MDKFTLICSLITALCGIIPTIVAVVILIKKIIEEKNWKLVETMVKNAMVEAERYMIDHPVMSDDEKIDFIIQTVSSGLSASGIQLDEDLTRKIVDYIRDLSNWVSEITVCSNMALAKRAEMNEMNK